MAGSVAQVFDGTAVPSGTTCTVSATLTGNGIVAAATNDASNASTISAGDPTNGATSYTVLDVLLDTSDQQQMVTFGKANSTASGSVTATFTWSVANAFKAGLIIDCTGVAGALDQHTGSYQPTPTLTTDAQTSGTTGTLATQPALVVGIGFNSNGTSAPNQGSTGWSPPVAGVATWWSFGGPLQTRVQFKRVTSTAAVAALFTATSNTNSLTAVVVIDEVGASLPAEPSLVPDLPLFLAPPTLAAGARSFVAYPPVSPAPPVAPAMSWQAVAARIVIAPRPPLSGFVAMPATTPAAPALPLMGWLAPQVRPPTPTPPANLGQRKGVSAYQAALPGVLNFSWMTQPLFPFARQPFIRPSSPIVPPTVPPASTTLLLAGGGSDERAGAETLVAALAQAGGVSSEIAGASTLAGALALVGGASLEAAGALAIAAALQQPGGLSSESAGASTLAALLALAGGSSEERPGAIALIQSLITLLMVGGASSESGGAETIAATLAPSGGASSEFPGSTSSAGALALAGGKSGEASGAETIAATLAPAGGSSSELAGNALLSAVLAIVGGKSDEAAGAVSVIIGLITLLISSGHSGEAAGAVTGSGVLALAGGASSETPGAETLAAILAQAGGLSEERAGAIAVQVIGILLLISSGHSDGAAGAETLTALLTPAGGASGEAAGDMVAAQILSMAGGLSEEAAGAMIVKIGKLVATRIGAGPTTGRPSFRGPT